jgi:small GTP-binding protein
MEEENEIRRIEEEIRKTKYNKHTQYHIGRLKAKLARLREELTSRKTEGGGRTYSIRKSGDATVLLVGFPSVGKSTLLNRITSAESKVGEYDFTTNEVIPGVMFYNSSHIQILDIPGLISGASSGKGRGREILSFVRNADLILIMIDNLKQLDVIERELYDSGFRLNEKTPDVIIKKMDRGGIKVSVSVRLAHIDEAMVKIVLKERGYHNAEILIREDLTFERLLDATFRNRVYLKSIVLYNKVDLLFREQRDLIPEDFIQISSLRGEGIEDLKKRIWDSLGLVRIYLKKIGRLPDMKAPLIMKKGSKVSDVSKRVHKDFAYKLDYARIWGPSAKFPEQKVGKEKVLRDGDIVELHIK